MKHLITNISSGIIGGLLCFFLIKFFLIKPQIIEQPTNKRLVSSFNVPPIPTGLDFVNAAKTSTNSVVHIHVTESDQQFKNKRRANPFGFYNFEDFFGNDFFSRDFFRKQEGSGSGVIYTKDGYIITNDHVVDFADQITVTTSDGKEYKAKKIGSDPLTDIAVIKIQADGLQPISFGNSDNLKVGEWVLAVGSPFGYLTSTVTAGIVSAKGRELDLKNNGKSIEEFIQTDAAVNPGNSGGALVNTNGELVGINTAIATPTGVFAGYSFAIPSNLVKPIVNTLIETGGSTRRMSLGIGGYDVNAELVKDLGLKVNYGFYIEEFDTKSPAKYAGILPGDVIVKINNKTVKDYDDINTILKYASHGDTLQIVVNRNGKELTIPTKLKKGL